MTTRRGFLAAMLAVCAAPAIASLPKVAPTPATDIWFAPEGLRRPRGMTRCYVAIDELSFYPEDSIIIDVVPFKSEHVWGLAACNLRVGDAVRKM